MFFAKESFFPIGIDISDLSLKLVQLNKIGDKIKIQALSAVNLPEGLIVNGEVANEEEAIKAIKKLISSPKYGKVSSDHVIACLPDKRTFIKLIKIEKSPNKLTDVIETEIEKHIPVSASESYYDWQIIEEDDDSQLVLVGVAPRKIVNQYTDLLDKAELTIEALEIEPMAICRSLLIEESLHFKGPNDKNYIIIDMGASHTSLTAYSKNTILFSVGIPMTGNQVTEKIAANLEIKMEEAEKAKLICGLQKEMAEGVINKILADVIKELRNKVLNSLQYYNNNFSSRGAVNKILLCGGGANIKGIKDLIYESTSIPVENGYSLINLGDDKEKFASLFGEKTRNNFKSINKSGQAKEPVRESQSANLQDPSLSFTTAIGLALRGLFADEL